MSNVLTMEKLTEARHVVLRSARFHPPSAWVVSATGHRTGHERNAWKKNCVWLAEKGLLRASPFDDWYLTEKAEDYLRSIGYEPRKDSGMWLRARTGGTV